MDFNDLIQYKLEQKTNLKPFKCEEEDLNGFLWEDAKNYEKEFLAVTYILEDPIQNKIVAYYSLLADKITFNAEDKSTWNKISRKIPNPKRRRSYPAIKIGRLAVNQDYSNQGIGTFIIDNLKYIFYKARRVGCRFLTVDALNSSKNFYLKNGFQFFTNSDKEEDTRLMFFDLKNFTN